MKPGKKWMMRIVSIFLVVLLCAMIGFGVYGCKKEKPQEEYDPSTEPVEQELQKEDASSKESVSLENANDYPQRITISIRQEHAAIAEHEYSSRPR